MLSGVEMHRIDPLRQAEEMLAQFAQSTEIDTHVKKLGRDVVNAVDPWKDPKDTVKAKAKLASRKVTNANITSVEKMGTSDQGALTPRRRLQERTLPLRLVMVVVVRNTI